MIREHPRGGRLEVRVYAGKAIAGGSRYVSRTVTGTGREAWRKAKRLEQDLVDEVAAARARAQARTVGELLDAWLTAARLEASTLQRRRSALAVHVRPRIGDIDVGDVTTEALDNLYTELLKQIAPSSVRRIHGDLHAAFAQAVTWRWIPENPAAATRTIVVPPPDPKPPPVAGVRALLELVVAENPDLACWLEVDAVTGMRRGEICALRRSDLDLDRALIRKTHAIGEGAGGWYEKPVKNRARHPIAIDPITVTALRAQLERVDKRAADVGVALANDPYVFTGVADGSAPWTPNHATKAVARLRDRVPAAAGITPNALRHFVATVLLAAGVGSKEVAGRLGHTRTSTTVDIYAGFLPAADREAAHVIREILASGT